MNSINMDSLADLFFELKWEKNNIRHTDTHFGCQVNMWRDIMPEKLLHGLMGRVPGEQVCLNFAPGEIVADKEMRLKSLKRDHFDPNRLGMNDCEPRQGRFYPKGILKDLPNIFRHNCEPFRCVSVNTQSLMADLGHPLARVPLQLQVTVGSIQAKTVERGGSARDWSEILTSGPGMQACWDSEPTDFWSSRPFARKDEHPDADFYKAPRFVQHLDNMALDQVRQLYAGFVQDGMNVLDLMASWHSHLPEQCQLKRLTGFGLNADELNANTRLTDRIVHDLNKVPILPIPDTTYDAAICTASVEYLTQPVAVFQEVARVLKPGGRFILTFSNRWFEPKTIRIWTELHEFERMGLILDYFRRSGKYSNLETYSIRGLMRPHEDKYFGQLQNADPIYAVWAKRIV